MKQGIADDLIRFLEIERRRAEALGSSNSDQNGSSSRKMRKAALS
jgi:hypothetical protein